MVLIQDYLYSLNAFYKVWKETVYSNLLLEENNNFVYLLYYEKTNYSRRNKDDC